MDLVVAETIHVLEFFYEVPRDEVAEAIRSLLAFDSIQCVDRALLLRTLEIYELDRLDFAEAYLLACAETTGIGRVASFDRTVDRVDTVERVEPPRLTITCRGLAIRSPPPGLVPLLAVLRHGKMSRDASSCGWWRWGVTNVTRSARRRVGRVRLVVVVAGLGLFGLVGSGCSTHEEAVSNPCKLTEGGRVVAVEGRGAMGLAKVGLTPEGLKAQEACK